ncbi:MAG: METTL5 family protein [Methanosarcinales archaeon]
MKKKKLEILLERVKGFKNPNPFKEQYMTPAPIAAELLHFAYMRGDLDGTVYDLGCGTGILAIGAKLLGAKKVYGFDYDMDALKVAKSNARELNVDIEFINCNVRDIKGFANTVVMNPPFGAQVKSFARGSEATSEFRYGGSKRNYMRYRENRACEKGDRSFLKKALEISEVVYSIHNAGSMEFIKKFINPSVITDCYLIEIPIKRTFKFHKKDIKVIKAEIYRIKK